MIVLIWKTFPTDVTNWRDKKIKTNCKITVNYYTHQYISSTIHSFQLHYIECIQFYIAKIWFLKKN